jgi:thiol-disulfide isomerase/thioredoxin/uncharacterized membrane protein YphA (DoxX/SURF4 family)
MDTFTPIAQLALAAVFALSGLAKLADLPGSRQALRDFGVPKVLAAPLGVILPVAELALAGLLLFNHTAWWGAIGAFGLLLVFSAVVAFNLLRGRRPDCRCFGRFGTGPIGWGTLARNGALLGLAGFLVWQGPGLPPLQWSAAAWVGLALVLGGMGWLLLALWRQQGRLLLRLEALEAAQGRPPEKGEEEKVPGLLVGSPAPAFRLPDLAGRPVGLDELLAPGRPLLLLFTDPHCEPCKALLAQLEPWQREHDGKLGVVPIGRGPVAENLAIAREYGLATVLLQRNFEVAEAFGVAGTPSAVLVHPDGTIASPVTSGAQAITNLVTASVSEPAAKPQTLFGRAAPPVRLADLAGRPVRLEDFHGRDTLLVFWNSNCGFCRGMLPELERWGREAPPTAPRLVLVSALPKDAVPSLQAPVLFDEDFAAGRAFGVRGTPSAVLLDAEGRVASSLAVGGAGVLELARGSIPQPVSI